MENAKIYSGMRADARRGGVLLFVLGVLAILSLLGTALLAITRREAAESKAYVDSMRAQWAAESGLEAALSKLDAYKGDLAGWTPALATVPDCRATPLSFLKTCTYGSVDTDGDDFNDAAGIVSETYVKNGDLYRLRVVDGQGKININDTNTPWNIDTDPYEDQWTSDRDYQNIPLHLKHPDGKDPDWVYYGEDGYQSWRSMTGREPHPRDPGRLWHIIESLVGILFQNDPNTELSKQVADAIFKERALRKGRFANFTEIREILVPQYFSTTQYNLFASYITLSSWQDPNVIQPTFQWRINTPPRLGPNDPKSSHLKYYPGDAPYEAATPDVGQTPTYQLPIAPRPDGFQALPFDYDGSGSVDLNADGTAIMEPIPSTPFSRVRFTPDIDSKETSLNFSHDIYLYTDMQTRYFALEPRSPFNVNSAPRELLQALIAPVQGWYLKEAPSVWDGESSKSRAEDWSQPSKFGTLQMSNRVIRGFPWSTLSRSGVWDRNFEPTPRLPPSYNPSNQYYSTGLFQTPDDCQYYFYDALARNYISAAPPRIPAPYTEYALGNARFGELCQSKSPQNPLRGNALVTVAEKLAAVIYDRIHPDPDADGIPNFFKPFMTWEEFETFLLDLADLEDGPHLTGDLRDFDIYMAHALIANFNPNSRLNDFNPNKRFFLHVDKSQLISNSAEFTFGPSGYFDIQSLGQVSMPDGKTPLTAEAFCGTRILESFRVSSQEQFMRGSFSASERFSEANDVTETSGAKTGYRGSSLQSYPEPDIALSSRFGTAIYDGFLMLSTYKPPRGEQFEYPNGNQDANNGFYGTFDGIIAADFSRGDPNPFIDSEPGAWRLDDWRYTRIPPLAYAQDMNAQVPTNIPANSILMKRLDGTIYDGSRLEDKPGNLHPDGVLSDVGRTPVYASLNVLGDNSLIPDPANPSQNIPADGRRGSVQFWIKPNFDVAHSNRVRRLFSAPPRSVEGDPATALRFWTTNQSQDYMRDFSLLYFARGGRRVPGSDITNPASPLDEAVNLGYSPIPDNNEGRWLPTRSFFFAFGRQTINTASTDGKIYGVGSTTANQSWRDDGQAPDPALEYLYQFETRQWTHISFSWDWVGKFVGAGLGDAGSPYLAPARFWSLCFNGKPVMEDRDETQPLQWPSPSFTPIFWSNNYAFRDGIQKLKSTAGLSQTNYFRFGESSSSPYNNHVADATYDDFVSSTQIHPDLSLQAEFGYGRYYASNDAVYTSPEFNLARELNLADGQTLSLFSVMWTSYWPCRGNNSAMPNHPRFNDNREDGNSDLYGDFRGIAKTENVYPSDPMCLGNGGQWIGDWIPNSIDIMNGATGNWRYSEELGLDKKRMPNFAGGSQDPNWQSNPLRWNLRAGQKLRFRVHFNIEEGQTLFTSPVFDDITFYFKTSGAKILFWERR